MSNTSPIFNLQWRQGSLIPREALPQNDLPSDLPAEAILILISHDCDVVHLSYEQEPWVEVLVARPIPALNGLYTNGRNPRRMHFSLGSKNYEVSIHERFRTARQHLEQARPDCSELLGKADIHKLARWVAKRYSRSSFPTAFNDRVTRVGKKIKKLLEKSGHDISAIFLALDESELPTGEVYKVVLRLVIPVEAGEDNDREQTAIEVTEELRDLLNQCEGIEVIDAELKTEAEFSLADYLATRIWDYDYISGDDGSDPISSEVI